MKFSKIIKFIVLAIFMVIHSISQAWSITLSATNLVNSSTSGTGSYQIKYSGWPYTGGFGGSRTEDFRAFTSNSWIDLGQWDQLYYGGFSDGNVSCVYTVFDNQGPGRIGSIIIYSRTHGTSFSWDLQREVSYSHHYTNIITVYQVGSDTFSLAPTNRTHANTSVAGQTVTVTANVSSNAKVPWTASKSASWITVTGGASGTNSGVVTYSVQANPGPARVGTITVAGGGITKTCTVSQSAANSIELSPASHNHLNTAVTGQTFNLKFLGYPKAEISTKPL